MSVPIIGLWGPFVKTLAADKYKICIVFPTFWQRVVLEGDRPPAVAVFDRPSAVAVFDRPFEVYWHLGGTLQLKKNQNYNRFKLVIGNWLF